MMNEEPEAADTEAALHLQNSLFRLYLEQRHTDVTVSIENAVFQCHKTVLAATSPYFDAMFSCGMRESVDSCVRLQGISAGTFQTILKFLYSGKCDVNLNNAEDILKASAMYQMTLITDRCETFLSGHVSADNCISVWKIARAHACKVLEESAFKCILAHFQEVNKSDEFFCLDKDELRAIVANDELHVPHEEVACDAVFSWVKVNPEQRSHHLSDLLEYVRLPLVSSEYLINEVESHPAVKDSSQCQMFLREAISYHMLPARRHEYISPRSIHRHHSHREEVFVLLGGYSEGGDKLTDVLAYSFRKQKWFVLSPLLFKLGREYCCSVYDNDIFVSGGSQKPQSLIRFNAKDNEWQRCPQMLTGRRRHAMVAVGESLYVLGGYDDKTSDESKRTLTDIEKYQVTSGTWQKAGCLVQAVRSMSASVSKEKIFVFGGLQCDETETSAIQCYDTRFQSSYFIGNMCIVCKLTRSVSYNNCIYIFCTDGTVMQYDEDFKCKIVSKIPNFNRRRFGALRCHGGILLVGGELGDTILRNTAWYDPVEGEASPNKSVSFTPPNRANFGVANIVIKKKFLNVEWLENE